MSSTDLLARIAWLYYQENLTQEALARRLGISRQKVQRLLSEARDLGIVHVRIQHPTAHLLEIEHEMTRQWSLQEALIVPRGQESEAALIESLGRAAASYLERASAQLSTLGVGLGRTLHAMSRHFAPEAPGGEGERRVVSVMGNLLGSSAINPYSIGERLAERWDASFYNLWAPAIVSDRNAAEVFRAEPWIQQVHRIGQEADLTISGLGTVMETTSLVQMGFLKPEEAERLREKGAVGSILSQYFDEAGNLLEDEVHDRVMALSLAGLRDRGGVMLVAGGVEKRQALHGALRGGYVRVLVTDELTALWLRDL
ncbi:MAG: sugar-binding transcriptional regulator [Armatimonadetes bacterium]|nr:sugar-binding transcriptional regulator [Armatimonadota bacterium]